MDFSMNTAKFLFVLIFLSNVECFAAAAAPSAAPAARPLSQLVRELIAAPDSPVLHYEIGLSYGQHGIWPQAEKEFRAAMEMARKYRNCGITDAELNKSYLHAVRAQRPLAAELKRLQDVLRATPGDIEIAGWLAEIYLDKGDANAAGSILASHPSLKQNPDILAKWVGTGAAAGRDGVSEQEERFKDLATLMEVGSESHKTTAARQILELAGRMPVSTVSAERQRAVDRAFEKLKTGVTQTEEETLKIYQDYLSVLDQWKIRGKSKSLIQEIRRRWDSAKMDPSLVYHLARLQAADGQTDEALFSIREALRLGYDEGPARIIYADLLEKKGKTTESLGEYLTAMEGALAAPDRAAAADRVEKWMASIERLPLTPESAEPLIRRAATAMPQSARAQLLWAKKLESKGETQMAYDRYAAASRINEQSPAAREGMARAAIVLGKPSDVGAALQRLDAGQIRTLWIRSPSLPVGRRMLAMGDTDPIHRLARQLSVTHAGTPDQISLVAELAVMEGKFSEAMSWYDQLKSRRTLSEVEEQKWNFARQNFLNPETASILAEPQAPAAEKIAWVREKIRTQNFVEADKLSRTLRELVRDTPDAYGLLGQYEASMGNRGAAESAYLLALRGNLQNEDAVLGYARLLLDGGETVRAKEMLSQLQKKSKESRRMLSKILSDMGEWEAAANLLEESIETEQDTLLTAWNWFRAGQVDRAFRFVPGGGLFEAILEAESGRFQKLEKKNPKLLRIVLGETENGAPSKNQIWEEWANSVLAAARQRSAAGDEESALALCDGILRRGPAAEAHYLKGVIYLKLGLYTDAKSSLEKAAKSPQWSVPANLKLGQLALMQDRPDEALRYLDHAGPGSDPAELILAWGTALALTKSPEQGEQIVRQVSQKSPRGKFFLGRLLERQGRTKEAVEIYTSAARESGGFIPARYRLGEIALQARDSATAEMSFAAVLQNSTPADPYHRMAEEKMQEIRRRSGKPL